MIPTGYRCIECDGTEAHAETCGQPARDHEASRQAWYEEVARYTRPDAPKYKRVDLPKYGSGPPSAFAEYMQREANAYAEQCAEEDSREQLWRSDGGPMEGLRFKP